MRTLAPALAFAVIACAPLAAGASTVLYQNDFESPVAFVDTTGRDVSQQQVNDLYGRPGFLFQQVNTVETLEIHGGQAFGSGYSDPAGTGGNYALGMLSSVQDDRASLTFDVGAFRFLNLAIDISAIDLDGVGGPFGVSQPIFRISLYDSPGGSFDMFQPGTLLDQHDATGTGTPSAAIFDWTHIVAALDATGTQDGNVTVVWDLIQSGYASFDNLLVVASDTPGDVPEPTAGLLLALSALGMATSVWRRPRSL